MMDRCLSVACLGARPLYLQGGAVRALLGVDGALGGAAGDGIGVPVVAAGVGQAGAVRSKHVGVIAAGVRGAGQGAT